MEENHEIDNTKDNIIDGQTTLYEEKSEAIAHKNSALKRLDTSFNKHIELMEFKKSHLLSYWVEDFSEYHDGEKTFSPKSLKHFKRGDIIKVNLGFNIGKELGGLHYCVVINNNDNFNSYNLNVIPLSSAKENKDYNAKTCIDLKDELYNLLLYKYNHEMAIVVKLMGNPEHLRNLEADEISKISNRLNLLKKLQNELEKMKQGSIAYVHQITTISKQRIFKTPILSGIKLSSHSLDLIDNKIMELFTKNKKNVYFI